jgi:hypothetical protein
MAVLNNSNAISPSGYDVNNSLRFRRSASASLTRTPSSATNKKTWTWSGWVKRGLLSSDTVMEIYYANNSTALFDRMYFHNSNGTFQINGEDGTALAYSLVTTQVFRDPSAWYHIVFAFDTTQATASNRIKLYVNGVQVTAFSTASYPSLNYDTQVNNNVTQYIGTGGGGASDQLFDGYLAEAHFIDGSAKTPSDFGETDTTTGVWKPKAYTGTYGTNGFYLKFSDIATTSGSNAGLGKDFSGNANYWTTNNISVTAGTTYDAMTDSPTLTNPTVANYCVLNPLDKNATGVTISSANLKNTTSSLNVGVRGTMAVSSGKWYWETTITTATNTPQVGIATRSWALDYVGSSNGVGYLANATKYVNGAATSYGATFTTGDIIGVALDMDGGSITFYKNNVSQGSAATGLSGEYFPAVAGQVSDVTDTNFGQRPFAYTPPTGFVRLNTFNLPDSTIKKGNTVMDATLYTGNGTANTNITNTGSFYPSFTWIKKRSAAASHTLFDTIRGATNYLVSDSTGAETTAVNSLTAFNSNGFTLGNGSGVNTNDSGSTYVAWQWNANNGSTSSNTSGSITSTVSVNANAGFSVVTYTGNGSSSATVGHGLGVAPSWVIIKNRGAVSNWVVRHSSLSSTQNVSLNTTDAAYTVSSGTANGGVGAVTSTTFGFISGTVGLISSNASAATYVAYCWSEIAGFSKFGSYTGNASTDGPFNYLGFRPKFVMIKRTDSTGSWFMVDTSRNTYNLTDLSLYANLTDAEGASASHCIDILSNGFKCKGVGTNINASGGTYIYAAFAENPFKNANAR